MFGPESSPNVGVFRILNENWADIKNSNYAYVPFTEFDQNPLMREFHESARDALSIHANQYHFRNDYAELIDLCLKFLGVKTNRKFKVPGATSGARWMCRAIYALKTYLFRHTLELDDDSIAALERFCLFVSLVYTKYWNQCPNVADAPVNDLALLKEIHQYGQIDIGISTVTLTALHRHLWYLSDELVALALFSDKLSSDEKFELSLFLLPIVTDRTENSIRHTEELEDIPNIQLSHFFSSRTYFIFEALNLDASFLTENADNWNESASYRAAKELVNNVIVVVNDAAERALQLGGMILDDQRVQTEERLQDFLVSAFCEKQIK